MQSGDAQQFLLGARLTVELEGTSLKTANPSTQGKFAL
jgi:hypothetical protein